MIRVTACVVALCAVTISLGQSLERPTPSTQPALTSTAELLKLVPEGVIPKPGREWNSVKTTVVQQALDQAAGRAYKLAAVVRSIQRDRNDVSVLMLEPADNTPYPTIIVARLMDVDLLTLARMDAGDRVNVEGTIEKVQLRAGQEGGMGLHIQLDPAKLNGPAVKGEPPPQPTTKPQSP